MSQSKLIGALTGLALLAACGGSEGSSPVPEAVGQGMSWEQFLSGVYQEPDTGIFIADGDTTFANEKLLREFYENNVRNGQLIVHTAGGVDAAWSETQKKNITYCVSTTFGSHYDNVVTTMANAAAAWEAAANVDFIYVSEQDANCTTSNTNVVFDVRPVNSGGEYLARAFFPNDTRANSNVLIDDTAFGNTSPWTLTGLLRHELGHTLGFRHEHTRPESGTCFEDNNWRQLTAYDSASVMHYSQCNGSQSGDLVLTAKDTAGAVALYGLPGGTVPVPDPGTGATTTETRSALVLTDDSSSFGPFEVVAGTSFDVSMTGRYYPDLYVRLGAAPSTTAYDCRPHLRGATESCSLTVPAGTTQAYIMVYGDGGPGSADLTITYTKRIISPGTPSTDSRTGSVAANSNVNFPGYDVVAGTLLRVEMTGTGDPDLYVRFGAAPTTTAFACRSNGPIATETCEVMVPVGATTAYVMVHGYTEATYDLTIHYTKPFIGGLPSRDSKAGSVAAGTLVNFPAYNVLAGSTFRVEMTGTGDPDLYVGFGAAPTTTTFHCAPRRWSSATETCAVTVPAGRTTAYVMVRGSTAATYALTINYNKR